MAYNYHPHRGYGPTVPWACNSSGCVHSRSCPMSQHFYSPEPVDAFSGGNRDVPAPSNRARGGSLKTVPCVFFQQGRCAKGDECHFAHTASNASDIRSNVSASMHCKFFRQGLCTRGENCTFVHDTAAQLPSTSSRLEAGHERASEVSFEASELNSRALVVEDTESFGVSSYPKSPYEIPLPPSPRPSESTMSATTPIFEPSNVEPPSPYQIPLPPSPRPSSAVAPVFEPCTYRTTGRRVRGDRCVVDHPEPLGQLYSPFPSGSPLVPDSKGDNGDWIQFSEEAIAQASTYDLPSPICGFSTQGVCELGDACRCRPNSFHGSPTTSRVLIPCKYFPTGTCAKGNLCPFVHDIRSQNTALHLTVDDGKKIPLCRYQGKCRKNSKCPFLHEDPDETLRRDWTQPEISSPRPPFMSEFEDTGEKTGWLLDIDHNPAWGPDLQAASQWAVEDPLPGSSNRNLDNSGDDSGTAAAWIQEADENSEWVVDQQAETDKWATSGQVGESSGTGWLQESVDSPAWGVGQQAEGQFLSEDSVKDVAAEESWNVPWPDAVPEVKRPKEGYCKYFGQGHCYNGDACQFLHVQEEPQRAVDPDAEPTQEDLPESSVPPAPEELSLPPQALYHCMVQFGAGAIPERVLTAFDSLNLIVSNYPAGMSHADLLQLAEPYGVVKNTTFRLATGGIEAYVEFEEYSQAAEAGVNLNGTILDEQTIHARLDSGLVGGTIHDPGIERQVKLVWDAPSVSGWVFYSSVKTAKDESVRLNGVSYRSRQIMAEYRKPSQKHSFPVRIAGLPPDVKKDDIEAFCIGSSSISLNNPNYLQSQDENIYACLAEFGPVNSFETLPTDPSHLKITGFARFFTGDAAANAVKALKGTPQDFLGKGTISVQPIFHSKYQCANCPFSVIRDDLDRLRESAAAPASGCTIRYYEQPPCVHVYGQRADAVALAAQSVQALVFGIDLPHYDPYFDTRPAEEALRHINNDPSFYIQNDKRRRVLRIWGDRETGEKKISRLLKRVQSKRHSLNVERSMPALLGGGLESLQEEFGGTKILLDVRSQTLTVLGDVKTEVENRLKDLASIPSSGTGDICCLCFSDTVVEPVELTCGHIYCASCLKHLLRPIPGIDSAPPTCVAEGASPDSPTSQCLTPISIPIILSHLSDEEQAQLFESSLLSFVGSRSEYRFCLSGCFVIYRIGTPGVLFTCPECGLELCASCAVPIHPGLTCAAYQGLGGGSCDSQ
ncbi:hypothetical protein DFH07DRAFT_327723 [Mycena maculata]|uniref:RING-type E3 ubiquitin transferase n=1 Tax=Mycena maculata TaxID=230809 RepID=A0AAD7JMS1_9AGAR|nr:hypothetical protein DFH07DRAFT_327723 [Mycena maculata]